jgi:hypothetical protein
MQCKFNQFHKSATCKTGYKLTQGEPIFGEIVYLLAPFYVHRRSPEFTLVCRGKHVTGLFKIAPNTYLGDFQKNALIIFLSEGESFDLFLTDLPPVQARQLLLAGRLNEILSEAREEAAHV